MCNMNESLIHLYKTLSVKRNQISDISKLGADW